MNVDHHSHQSKFMKNRNSVFQNRKLLFAAGFTLVFIFILWHIFSPGGMHTYLDLKTQLLESEAKNNILEKENSALREEIDKLENNPEHIEKIAREKFGMIRKNETLYKFKKKEH